MDRKFARVQDVPTYGHMTSQQYLNKVFKVYTKLWKYQQDHRSELVDSGLHRWEIGEIASRISKLYFDQYMRTSEARFLIEAYVFYEAILNRHYFEGSKGFGKDLGVRFKELTLGDGVFCRWVRGFLQTWWLMGFSEFEIFFVWIGCVVFFD